MAKTIRTRVTEKGVISELVTAGTEKFSVDVVETPTLSTVGTVTTASMAELTVVGAAAMVVLPGISTTNLGTLFTLVNTGSADCSLTASNPLRSPSGSWTTDVAGANSYSVVQALEAHNGYFWIIKTL